MTCPYHHPPSPRLQINRGFVQLVKTIRTVRMDWYLLFCELVLEMICLMNMRDALNLYYALGALSRKCVFDAFIKGFKPRSRLNWHIFHHQYLVRETISDISTLTLCEKYMLLRNCDSLQKEDYEHIFSNNTDICDLYKPLLKRHDVPLDIFKNVCSTLLRRFCPPGILIDMKVNHKNNAILDEQGYLKEEIFDLFGKVLPKSLIQVCTEDQLWKHIHADKHPKWCYFVNASKCKTRLTMLFENPPERIVIIPETRIPFEIVKRYRKNFDNSTGGDNSVEEITHLWLWYLRRLIFEILSPLPLEIDKSEFFIFLTHNKSFQSLVANGAIENTYLSTYFTKSLLFNFLLLQKIQENFFYNLISLVLQNDNTLNDEEKRLLTLIATNLRNTKLLDLQTSKLLLKETEPIKWKFMANISVFPMHYDFSSEQIFEEEQARHTDVKYLVRKKDNFEVAISAHGEESVFNIIESDESKLDDIIVRLMPNLLTPDILCRYQHSKKVGFHQVERIGCLRDNIHIVSPGFFQFVDEEDYDCLKKYGILVEIHKTGTYKFTENPKHAELIKIVMSFFKYSIKFVRFDWCVICDIFNHAADRFVLIDDLFKHGYYDMDEALAIKDIHDVNVSCNRENLVGSITCTIRSQRLIESIHSRIGIRGEAFVLRSTNGRGALRAALINEGWSHLEIDRKDLINILKSFDCFSQRGSDTRSENKLLVKIWSLQID